MPLVGAEKLKRFKAGRRGARRGPSGPGKLRLLFALLMLSLTAALVRRPWRRALLLSPLISPPLSRHWTGLNSIRTSSGGGGGGGGRGGGGGGGGKRGKAAGSGGDYETKMFQFVRAKDFESAMKLYEQLKAEGFPTRPTMYNALLNVCSKKEHLASALQLFNETQRSETAYLALIRCYAAAGEIDTALGLVAELEKANLEPRLRTYHPIFEAICSKGDIEGALRLTTVMLDKKIVPRSDHLELLIATAASASASSSASSSSSSSASASASVSVDGIVSRLSVDLLGMQSDEMQRLVGSLRGLTPEEVQREGVLVESIEAIRGAIINEQKNSAQSEQSEQSEHSTGERKGEGEGEGEAVMAVCNKYLFPLARFTGTSPVPAQADAGLPVGASSASEVASYNERYSVLGSAQAAPGFTARIVDVSDRTGRCPNCASPLQRLVLTEQERSRVRAALGSVVETFSPVQHKALLQFGEWMARRRQESGGEEFAYIVDGANVAYHKQNFEGGKFSFRQIQLVVDALRPRLLPKQRILVLIPYPYARKVVPNSTKSKKGRKLSYLTSEEADILEGFERDGMLYVVPQWANDDWYWMYATLDEGRKGLAQVVTNDLMRDHRLAFLEPRPFMRWRSSQVLHFDLSHAVAEPRPAASSDEDDATTAAATAAGAAADEGAAPRAGAGAEAEMPPSVRLTDPGTRQEEEHMIITSFSFGHSPSSSSSLHQPTSPITT